MDTAAQFSPLLIEHRDRIYRIVSCYVLDPEERNDVYQEILIHLWQGLATFRGSSSLGTWVYRVAVNTCLGHLRSAQRHRRMVAEMSRQSVLPEITAAQGADSDPAGTAAVHRLYTCIQELSPVERALVSLYLEEASTSQIAEVLGISEGNARVKLHRARKNLKAIWERMNDGAG